MKALTFHFELLIRNPKNLLTGYTLSCKDDHSFWMEKENGEGAEFRTSQLFEVLDKFYKDNF